MDSNELQRINNKGNQRNNEFVRETHQMCKLYGFPMCFKFNNLIVQITSVKRVGNDLRRTNNSKVLIVL